MDTARTPDAPAPTTGTNPGPDCPPAQPAPDYGGFWIGSRDVSPTYVPGAPSAEAVPLPPPAVSDLAYDTRRDRYGVVMERTGGQVHLRPKGGGLEREARPEDVEPAGVGEALGPRVARANARSRGDPVSRWNPPDPQNPPAPLPKVDASAYAPAAGLPGIPVGTLVRDTATGRQGILQNAFVYEPRTAGRTRIPSPGRPGCSPSSVRWAAARSGPPTRETSYPCREGRRPLMTRRAQPSWSSAASNSSSARSSAARSTSEPSPTTCQ